MLMEYVMQIDTMQILQQGLSIKEIEKHEQISSKLIAYH